MGTYVSCETTSNIAVLQPPGSIKNPSPFRRTMADYICSSSDFVASLQSERYIVIDYIYIYITRTTLMSPGQDETRVCGYVRSEFIH